MIQLQPVWVALEATSCLGEHGTVGPTDLALLRHKLQISLLSVSDKAFPLFCPQMSIQHLGWYVGYAGLGV